MRSDEELMHDYVRDDERAFRELFRRYVPILLRLLLRRVGRPSDAQDLVQQTFLQLHRARRDFELGMRVRPWIVTIAMNLARDHLRRRARRPESAIDDGNLPDLVATPPRLEAEESELAARVRSALAGLPRDQREVIELHWFQCLTFTEIATKVAATPGAVRVRAHRGYVNLRKTLRPLGGNS